ncbi:Ribonuclease T(2) [Bertholletia excelsa]
MKNRGAVWIRFFLAVAFLPVVIVSGDFDFFYLVQQWPGAYCNTKEGCCYPSTGRPAPDFTIHGLWPNYNNGSYPFKCDPDSTFDESKIWDLRNRLESEWPSLACPSPNGSQFWAHEWAKHGTCAESVLNQHDYFAAALNLRNHTNLLQHLLNAGIQPNGQVYSIESIKEAIRCGTGHGPRIACNSDPSSGTSQLYQVYVCANTSGTGIVDCPERPSRRCASEILFPSF